jgi:hypothetical protein
MNAMNGKFISGGSGHSDSLTEILKLRIILL